MSKMNSKSNEKFFTTRPKLASFLLGHGCRGELTVNPYDPSRPAWSFERCQELDTWVNIFFEKGGADDKIGNPR